MAVPAGLEFRDAVRRPSLEQGIEPEAVRNVACRVDPADLARRAVVQHAREDRPADRVARLEHQRRLAGVPGEGLMFHGEYRSGALT